MTLIVIWLVFSLFIEFDESLSLWELLAILFWATCFFSELFAYWSIYQVEKRKKEKQLSKEENDAEFKKGGDV